MSKLRRAVPKTLAPRLGQDVESKGRRVALRERRKRARGVESGAVKVGSHLPANENGGGQSAPEEPEAIREARKRLRAMIVDVAKNAPKPAIGIVLAIVNQETGNHSAANALIDEYGLDRLFGIKKFCLNG